MGNTDRGTVEGRTVGSVVGTFNGCTDDGERVLRTLLGSPVGTVDRGKVLGTVVGRAEGILDGCAGDRVG